MKQNLYFVSDNQPNALKPATGVRRPSRTAGPGTIRSFPVCFLALWLAVSVGGGSGCRRRTPDIPDDALNAPALREDARALMRELDRQAREQTLDMTVSREMRRRLTGRLLNAGLSQTEIDDWIEQ